MDFVPLINGTAHSWADIVINILGTPVAGITAINYDNEQTKEDNFGGGRFPVSRGRGSVKATASITLYSEELKAIQDIAPNGRIEDIPAFDIPVLYLPEGSANIKKDILRNVEFMKLTVDTKTGDTKIEVELPLIISHISFNQSV